MKYGAFREHGSVLTSEECAQLRLALQDPEYVSRMLADARVADMVEVDNPVRREMRPQARQGVTDGSRDVPVDCVDRCAVAAVGAACAPLTVRSS